jgi:hypothetical protein
VALVFWEDSQGFIQQRDGMAYTQPTKKKLVAFKQA